MRHDLPPVGTALASLDGPELANHRHRNLAAGRAVAAALLTACAGSGYARRSPPVPPMRWGRRRKPRRRRRRSSATSSRPRRWHHHGGQPRRGRRQGHGHRRQRPGPGRQPIHRRGSGAGRARTSMVLRVPAAKLDDVMRDPSRRSARSNTPRSTPTTSPPSGSISTPGSRHCRPGGPAASHHARRPRPRRTHQGRGCAVRNDRPNSTACALQRDARRPNRLQHHQRHLRQPRPSAARRPTSTAASSVRVERGWDALVSLAGDLVLLFGLLLPWLGALAVAGGVVYGIVRLVTRRRSRRDSRPNGVSAESTPVGRFLVGRRRR